MKKSLQLLSLLIVGVILTLNAGNLTEFIRTNIVDTELVSLTNVNRVDEELFELRVDPLLTRIAQAKADSMAEQGYFSHIAPDGTMFTDWLKDYGYDYLYAGENLAVKFKTSEGVVKAWLNSPAHRANIMSGNFEEIGVGIAEGEYKGQKTTFIVQLFGQKKVNVKYSTYLENIVAEGNWKNQEGEEKTMLVENKIRPDVQLFLNDVRRVWKLTDL